MRRHKLLSATIAAIIAIPSIVYAAEPAPAPLQFEWNVRLRHEVVDDEAFARSANATTLRVRAGVSLHFGAGFSALIEGEGIASADDAYNSGANGRTIYPTITDPKGIELNQAWLGWKGDRAGAKLGRQRLLFDNQRWIGNVGWRQNEQTFDAIAGDWQLTPTLTARYAWLDRVHRVNGDNALDPLARERDLSTHLFNLAWKHGAQQWVGYAYLHDDRDVASASTATYGVRWTGTHLQENREWGWTLESARQRDYAGNPMSFSHAYWLVEPSMVWHGVTYRAGWEHLGGNGAHSLQTPLATLHAFNGWADKFVVTPAGGLEDRYFGAGGKFGRGSYAGKLNWAVAWHDYAADIGGNYGREWDASVGFPVIKNVIGLVKIADYRSDGFARDTRKVWMQLEWTH